MRNVTFSGRRMLTVTTVSTALVAAGLVVSGPSTAAGSLPVGKVVAAAKAKPKPSPLPALSVEPFLKYRPESTGGYASVENGMTSIWFRFTTLQAGKGNFTFTIPPAPAGAKGFPALQTTDVEKSGFFTIGGQASDCSPVVTNVVAGEGIEQSFQAKYDCPVGRTMILQWRGTVSWNGFTDTNGPDLQPNPNDVWSFPVKVRFGNQTTYPTPPVVEIINYPAEPIGLEPAEFISNGAPVPDFSQPILLTDLASNLISAPTSLTVASRDATGTPVEQSYTILGGSVIGTDGQATGIAPLVGDPQEVLTRQVVTTIDVRECAVQIGTECPQGTIAAVEASSLGFTDQSGDPLPNGTGVVLYVIGISTVAFLIGSSTLCYSYGGEMVRYTGAYSCYLSSEPKMNQYRSEILAFRPEMGSWYCPSRQVTNEVTGYTLPFKVTCSGLVK